MKLIIITAAPKKGSKPFIGTADGFSYAIKIDSLENNDFPRKLFGRQIDDARAVREWMKTAKKTYVNAKHKPTLTEVKRFIKSTPAPKEFYAKWKTDSSSSKTDAVEIYYK